ncbi:MAG: diaminopimelate epimerase [Bacillota bacterium]
MNFSKVHGLGNDFVLVDATRQRPGIPPGEDFGQLARKICHRQLGVGADGLVILLPGEKGDVRMRIFNADGSEAQMCGNAVRCVAKYLYDRRLVPKEVIAVETLAGIIRPQIITDGGRVAGVRVDMGEPRLERSQIPMVGAPGWVIGEPLLIGDHVFNITAVSMGNPHCVIFVPDVDQVPLAEAGPLIERHPAFPERTNVEFVQVFNPEEVKMRVWERGAGPTLACGTGACAAAVAGSLNGLTEKTVRVHLPLGSLLIEWAPDNHLYMTGPAEEVFTGNYPV